LKYVLAAIIENMKTLLIAPKGIEIFYWINIIINQFFLLIAPKGIEIEIS